jgi:hypothetical protein
LLVHPDPPSYIHPGLVSAVARACGGSNSAQSIPDCDTIASVSPAACQSLRFLVEHAHAEAAISGSFAPKLSFTDQSDGMNSTQLQVVLGSCESDFKIRNSCTVTVLFILPFAFSHLTCSCVGSICKYVVFIFQSWHRSRRQHRARASCTRVASTRVESSVCAVNSSGCD